MANNYITLNGVSFSPTDIEMTPERIADTRRARSGKLRLYHWGSKNHWTITWTGIIETSVSAIRTIGLLTGVFVFTDVDGVSYNVIVTPGGYSQSLSAERQSIAGIYYYDITLELEEE